MIAPRVGALAFLLMSASAAFGQTLTGSIAGTVRDPHGGALVAATITVFGRTGALRATTDASGAYRFPAVDPGTYAVRAEASGFQPRRIEELTVSAGTQLTVDLMLQIAAVTESVDVVEKSRVVDVTSSSTQNGLSSDLLFAIPSNHVATLLATATPGVNDDRGSGAPSGFGSGVGGNALLLDGVDTRGPLYGTVWNFFNYDVIQEVQVGGLGAPAEYGGFTGVVVNTITRSGGNRLGGLFHARYTTKGLAADNVSAAVAAQNPSLAQPSLRRKLLDLTAQVSGPIVKDRLFFFANFQRFELDTDPPGPRTLRHESEPRLNAKLNWQPRAGDSLMAMLQYDQYNVTGLTTVPGLLATDELTGKTTSPELIWNLQWRHLFGSKALLEAKYVGWTSYEAFDPKVHAPRHADVTGTYSVSAGQTTRSDRARHQANVSLSRFAEAFGHHDLKFGLELERDLARDRLGYIDNISYYDNNGAPYLAFSYGYDVTGKNHRESAYAQDSWKAARRLTVNAGGRFDWIRGTNPDAGTVFRTRSFAPRIGLAFDLAGDRKSVLKASYARYHEAALGSYYRRALPGIFDFVTYDNTGPQRVEIDRVPAVPYSVGRHLHHPRVDELTAGIERALGPDLRLSLTAIHRVSGNLIDSVFPEARWRPVVVTNLLTNEPITVYRWANRLASQGAPLITNVDGFVYRDPSGGVIGIADAFRRYHGLMFVMSRRLVGRWQAQVSYVLSRGRGTVDNADIDSVGMSNRFESASTALVNTNGHMRHDYPHELKALGSYRLPKAEVELSAVFRSVSGKTWTPLQRLRVADIDFPAGGGRRVFLEPRGARRMANVNVLDLRVEKVLLLDGGRHRLGVYADALNVFNAGTAVEMEYRAPSVQIAGVPTPVLFGVPIAVLEPRQVTLGARWSF